jgi:hypothetical protein
MPAEYSGRGLVGTGFAEACKEVGKQLRLDHEQNFERRENELAAEAARSREGRHEYYLLVDKLPNGFIKVQTIEEFPLVGRLGAIGRNYDAAVTELRFAYAYELKKKGLIPSLDDARRYAVKCTFRPSLADSTFAI